ncbi:50S ribosomal protein L10 [Candidatus Bathyarchaeota archaeon]|nr:50S ribosomal protein L10 [Candidatus Bathyarchaeota archaeon]
MSTTLERPSVKRKAQEVEELIELIGKYDAVLIASLHKVRSIQLQELSKKFKDTVRMKVAKNSTLRRALETSPKPEIAALKDSSTGSNVLLLTNMNPFQLSILLDHSKVKMAAKAGDIAPDDIIVPAGNTGLPPGPAISELNEAGIRTRIESGSVYVLRDTVVAKKGEAIQPRVASVLSKLGVKPLEVGLSLKAAYEGGIFFKESDLHIDLEAVKRQLEEGFGQALALSINAAFLTSETATSILSNAHRNGLNLAFSSNYPTAETITPMLGKGYSSMVILSNMLAKVNPEDAPPDLGGDKEKS